MVLKTEELYNPFRILKGRNKIFLRKNNKILLHELSSGGSFNKPVNCFTCEDFIADFDIFSDKRKIFLSTITGKFWILKWEGCTIQAKGSLKLREYEKVIGCAISEDGRFAVLSTARERSLHFEDELWAQNRLILLRISKNGEIKKKDSIEFLKDKSFDDTCYTYLNMKFTLKGNPLLVCFEGAFPLLYKSEITVGNSELLSTRATVYKILIEREKFELVKTVNFYGKGGVYDGRFGIDPDGDECLWTVDLAGDVKCFKLTN